MISLDQILLLEEKVESAVEKIKQLEAENDALRSKCSELTNALSAKTEQLASFENEQKTIESGIIKAIDRLNSIENSVLKAAGQSTPKENPAPAPAAPATPAPQEEIIEEPEVAEEVVTEAEELPDDIPSEIPEEIEQSELDTQNLNFDSMEPVEDQSFEEEIPDDSEGQDPESRDELGFDIF